MTQPDFPPVPPPSGGPSFERAAEDPRPSPPELPSSGGEIGPPGPAAAETRPRTGRLSALAQGWGLGIALVLSLLPILLLRWDWIPEGERERAGQAGNAWWRSTALVASNFRRAASLPFWVRLAGQSIEDRARILFERRRPRTTADEVWVRAFRGGYPAGLPAARIWAFALDGSAGAAGGSVRMCQGAGLQTELRSFFSSLFSEVVRGEVGLPTALSETAWAGRLKGMFGQVVFSELFAPGSQGMPFCVIVRGEPQYFLWRVIRERGKGRKPGRPVGGFFLMMPIPTEPEALVRSLCFRHWSVLQAGQTDVWPAFVPLLPGGVGRMEFHPHLPDETLRAAVRPLAQEAVLIHSPLPGGTMGQARLPGSRLGRVLELGGFWGRILPLADDIPYYGLLLTRCPEPTVSLTRVLWCGWAGVACLVWGFLLLRRALTGRWPGLPVRHGLALWFLGLVCIPMTLGIKAGLTYLDDLGANLTESLRRGVSQVLADIESGSASLRGRHLHACRSLLRAPDLLARLQAVQLQGEADQPLLAALDAELRGSGIDPMAVLAFGHGGWMVERFATGVPESTRLSLPLLLGGFARQVLAGLDTGGKLQATVERGLADLHLRRPDRKPLIRGMGVGSLGIVTSAEYIQQHWDSVQPLMLGNRRYVLYYNLVPDSRHPWFLIAFFWNQENVYRQYLATALPEAHLSYLRRTGQSLGLAAFQRQENRLELVGQAGNVRGLEKWAESVENRVQVMERDGQLWVAVPCTRLPGTLLTARVSLDHLNGLLSREQLLWKMVILSLLVLAGLGGKGLSHWLASPVVRMTRGLQRVTRGDLEVRVREDRADELGQATGILDTMITWVRERERLLPFVSPRVLETVGGGNLFRAGAGSAQRVVALVSDIRSFTTLSESRPPAELFATLNEHLREMAFQVQEHGGSIDRFVGDALWAVFYEKDGPGGGGGAKAAACAVRAARAMMVRHAELNELRERGGRFPFEIGVGLDEGEVIAGILGDPESRLDFTVIGEPLAGANACEAASKAGNRTRIIGSGRVLAALGPSDEWEPLAGAEGMYELRSLREAVRQ